MLSKFRLVAIPPVRSETFAGTIVMTPQNSLKDEPTILRRTVLARLRQLSVNFVDFYFFPRPK